MNVIKKHFMINSYDFGSLDIYSLEQGWPTRDRLFSFIGLLRSTSTYYNLINDQKKIESYSN